MLSLVATGSLRAGNYAVAGGDCSVSARSHGVAGGDRGRPAGMVAVAGVSHAYITDESFKRGSGDYWPPHETSVGSGNAPKTAARHLCRLGGRPETAARHIRRSRGDPMSAYDCPRPRWTAAVQPAGSRVERNELQEFGVSRPLGSLATPLNGLPSSLTSMTWPVLSSRFCQLPSGR